MRNIAKKTILRFSRTILSKFPEMAGDAASASLGESTAWIRTSGRVINSICDVFKMCMQRKNEKILAGAVENEEELEGRLVREHIESCLSKEEEFFSGIHEKISEEYRRFEADIDDIPPSVSDVSEQMKKADSNIQQETVKKKKIINNREMAEREFRKAQSEQTVEIISRRTKMSRQQTQAIELVRQYLKEAIAQYDRDMNNPSITNELSSKEKAKLTECYRLLQWQYQKSFMI